MFAHVEIDREDYTTEYGGVIESGLDSNGAAGFRAVLFRPRARDRKGDNQFVASEDLIAYSDRALLRSGSRSSRVARRRCAVMSWPVCISRCARLSLASEKSGDRIRAWT